MSTVRDFSGLTVGGYRLKKHFGDKSSQGMVYRGEDEETHEPVAVKILVKPDPWRVDRFKQEAEIHRSLDHQNIVRIRASDYDDIRDVFYIVTDLIKGESLKGRLTQKRRGLSLGEIVHIVMQITSALKQIHGRGILYLDLKPANILLEKRKHLRLIDFGLGVWGPGQHASYGTQSYWAPEQVENGKLTEQTDLYNLGALLYQLCTGRLPFYHRDPAELGRKVRHDDLRPPSSIKPTLKPLDPFFRKALAKNSSDRYQTVEEMFVGLMKYVPEGIRRKPSDIPPGPDLPTCSHITVHDGVTIAYTVKGTGDHLIFLPPWISNQGFLWARSGFRSFCEKLANHCTLVFYDKRGCGRSSRDVTDCSLEAQLQDLQALAEHLKISSFGILAMSAGGPLAIRFAAENRKVVSKLILYGTYADGTNIVSSDKKKEQIEQIRNYWGRGPAARSFAELFVPSGHRELHKWLANYQAKSASAEHAALFLTQIYEANVTKYTRKVHCPTLILHRTEDEAIPYEMGLALKKLLPRATFRALAGDNHIPWLGNSKQVLDEIVKFLQRTKARRS